MNTQNKEEQTTNYYDNNAEKWVSTHNGYQDGTYWEEEMDIFQKLLPKGRVLEIGSGSGRDAEALVKRGYIYTGTDISKGLLDIARKRNPHVNFLNQSVYELDFNDLFDGFWCVATLLHIPKTRLSESLKRIHLHMRDGAIGFITVKKGEGEKVDESTKRLFSYYRQDEFGTLLEECGYKILDSEVRQSKEDTQWLMFWVQKS